MKRPILRVLSMTMVLGLLLVGTGRFAAADHEGHAHHDMKLVGTNDLQARSTYQPTLHKYGNGRYVLFTGHHALGTNPVTGLPLPSFNPLTGKNEENGVSIVDVTDPKKPVLLFHLPVSDGQGGGAQMVRVCDGNTLPIHDNKVYMLRTYANSAHEIWDVADPSNPKPVRTVAGGTPAFEAQPAAPGPPAGPPKAWGNGTPGSGTSAGRRATDPPPGGGGG